MIFATFIIRHIIAVVLCVAAACVGWTLLYVFLLIGSAIFGGHPGSPVIYPLVLVSLVAGVLAVGFFIFAPACGVGLTFTHLFKLPRLAAIPVVFGTGAVMNYAVVYVMMKSGYGHPEPDGLTVLWDYTIYLSAPLGIYWWLVEGPWAIVDLVRRMIRQKKLASQQATGLLTHRQDNDGS